MSDTDLSRFLKESGMKPIDVAHGTGLGLSTVYRFLRGEHLNDSTRRMIEMWVSSKVSNSERKAALG